MPQMCPMNWLMLMVSFTMMLFMCMAMIYYIYLPYNSIMIKTPLNKTIKSQLSWKW